MDENADRIPDYWLFDLRSEGTFEVIAQTTSTSDGRKKREDSSHSRQRRAITRVNTGSTEKTQSLADLVILACFYLQTWQFIMEPFWGDGSTGINNAPPDVPLCDFDGSTCGKIISNYNRYDRKQDT